MKKKKGLQKIILCLCLIPTLMSTVIISVVSLRGMKKGMEAELQNGLNMLASSTRATFTNLDQGEYHLQG